MKTFIFVDNKNIPLVTHQDEDRKVDHDDDCDEYNTLNTRVEETTFKNLSSSEKRSIPTLQFRQKVKWDNLAAFYRHLNVTGDRDLINLDQFNYVKNTKKGTIILEFYNDDKVVPLTKQTGKIFSPKTLRDRFGGPYEMKNIYALIKYDLY